MGHGRIQVSRAALVSRAQPFATQKRPRWGTFNPSHRRGGFCVAKGRRSGVHPGNGDMPTNPTPTVLFMPAKRWTLQRPTLGWDRTRAHGPEWIGKSEFPENQPRCGMGHGRIQVSRAALVSRAQPFATQKRPRWGTFNPSHRRGGFCVAKGRRSGVHPGNGDMPTNPTPTVLFMPAKRWTLQRPTLGWDRTRAHGPEWIGKSEFPENQPRCGIGHGCIEVSRGCAETAPLGHVPTHHGAIYPAWSACRLGRALSSWLP